MELVRRAVMQDDAQALRSVLVSNDRKTLKHLMWGIRRNPLGFEPHPMIEPPLNAVAWTSEIRRAEGQLVGGPREFARHLRPAAIAAMRVLTAQRQWSCWVSSQC
jgi:hypothetical protein